MSPSYTQQGQFSQQQQNGGVEQPLPNSNVPPQAFNQFNGAPQQRFPVPTSQQNTSAPWSQQPAMSPPQMPNQMPSNNVPFQPALNKLPISSANNCQNSICSPPSMHPQQQATQVPAPQFQHQQQYQSNNAVQQPAFVPPQLQQPNQSFIPSPPQQQNQSYAPPQLQQQNQSFIPAPPQQQNQSFAPLPPQNNMYYNNQAPRFMDLMQERNLLGFAIDDNEIALPVSVCNPDVHCSPLVFRCTMSAIPETTELVNKCRLPLGLTLQPFRDLKNLTVIQTNIVRCRYCRTYINPYVYLPDNRHWKCNLCYRVNDLPEEFTWDPVTKSFGDPSRRPELQNATIEYIAPSEYMLRAPQPVLYLFIFDVSSNAVDCGYLHNFAEQMLINLDQMPGDERTLIGFLGVDSALHFFQFTDHSLPPKHLVVDDIDEPFAPVNFGLVVELSKYKESIRHFIQSLPTLYESNSNASNCVGSALTIARDLIAEIGGRITVMLASNPNLGPGAVNSSPNHTGSSLKENVGNFINGTESNKNPSKPNIGPSTDFYKRLALECTGKQISVDLFVMGERHADIATLSEISKFSSGSIYHFPSYHFIREQTEVKRFQKLLNRYLTRKLGLEAVLRIRCSKGLSLHTFHGNFFVRSTDLLAMANVNPDSAIGVQIQLEESLSNQQTVCFQAALLYTSSRGDRRIRVHTLCLPVVSDFSRIFNFFDIKATVSMLAKMAAERAMTGADLQDCREALINACTDGLAAYNRSVGQRPAAILAPIEGHLKFLGLFVLGLLKNRAFSNSSLHQQTTGVDRRVAAMLLFKTAPVEVILLEACPALFSVHNIDQCEENPQRLPLSYERVNRDGVYLLDTGSYVYIYVCSGAQPAALEAIFGVNSFSKVDEDESLKQLENALSDRLHSFIRQLNSARGSFAPILVIRDDSVRRELFTRRLVEDRTEASHSYVEFLQHLKREISSG